MKYLSPRTREQTQTSLSKHIQQWQQHNFEMWAVIYKETGAMIGRCGLGFLVNTPEVELGYVLDKSYWKMGLATEASLATLKFGFWEVKLDWIVAIAHPENIASVRVIQKRLRKAIAFLMDVKKHFCFLEGRDEVRKEC